jgi:Rieske 2Fe-2S family protein
MQVYSREQRKNRPLVLKEMEPSFPNSWHYDPEHYQKELDAFWYRMWINVCRSDEVASPRDYKVVSIGDQNIVITRDLKGNLRAFHNTCRHRGSILCTQDEGRFEGGSIVCPYHAWTYSLEGKLIATPHQLESADFEMKDYSLYGAAVGEWGGFVFVNLTPEEAEPLEKALGDTPLKFKNYHPERLKVGFRYVHEIKANWKLWFENYSECFHCPQVHPELINIVPIYSKGLGNVRQDPEWKPSGGETMILHGGSDIIPGGRTWTMDGQLSGPAFSGLTEEEANSVINGMQLRPNFFFVAHPDYVHTQQMIPTSPTTVQLTWDYLFEPETMEREDFDAKRAYELWHITNLQDAQNVEWQQSGIKSGSRHHERSVFVPQETGPHQFNSWVMEVMESAGNGVLRRDG